MHNSFKSISLFVLSTLSVTLATAPLRAAMDTHSTKSSELSPAMKFDQGVDRIESMQLPLNKVWLYRQAAVAVAPTDKPRAVSLLKQALADIDSAEAAMKAQKTLDDKAFQQLEFHRLPVYMMMERIDPDEAFDLVTTPQTADRDTAFFGIFFERLAEKDKLDLVREAALRKLSYGVTPAVIGAYKVLLKHDPAMANSVATAIVLKLNKTDPADPAAAQAAFGLLRLLRTDVGALAPKMILDPSRMSSENVHQLFEFIGDAFLKADDPETLILGFSPAVYVAALQEYAPDKAQDVAQLPFAQPGYKSLIFAPETPTYDANHPDPNTLTPEQLQQRAAIKAQIEAQLKDTDAQMDLLIAKANQPSLPQKERDDAVFALVDEANKAIALARANPSVLDREAFRNGEIEIYNMGVITNVVETVSTFLQTYAVKNPKVAEAAAQGLNGTEVQTEVGLQVAIKEMTGSPAYLVPSEKPPATPPHPPAAAAAPAPASLGTPFIAPQ